LYLDNIEGFPVLFPKSLVYATLTCVAVTAIPAHATETSTSTVPVEISAQEVTRKVNVAGRQHMLSQRMAKASCLMTSDISAERHFEQLTQAHSLFARSDAALRYGDAEIGLGPETRRAVMRALEKVDSPWYRYDRLIRQVVSDRTTDEVDIERLSLVSVEVLRHMNAAVNQTARSYGNVLPDVPLALTITIDVAGRQRMLSQKAMKELCLGYQGTDPAAHLAALEGTISMFDLSLTALQQGFADVGVLAPPNSAIADQLALVRDLWAPIHDQYRSTIERGSVDAVMLEQMAPATDFLLQEMNRAVGMYEADTRMAATH
jgi:hypothetical protein